jgi:Resolvase, N terminal domain
VLARVTEVESGRKAARLELAKALQLAKVTGATLVIAKLDRLSRNVAFLLAMQDSGVRFVAVDLPKANDLTVGIMALVAQAEREAISRRTKEALAVARARGVKLGNPNGADRLRRAGKGGVALRATVSANAADLAADLVPVLADIRVAGHLSLRAIAVELTARGIRTRQSGAWCGEREGGVAKTGCRNMTRAVAFAEWRGLLEPDLKFGLGQRRLVRISLAAPKVPFQHRRFP